MTRPRLPSAVPLLLLLLAVDAAASLNKLDPLARRALARLETGVGPERLMADGYAVGSGGELNVFILGEASRHELEAAGARLRTVLPGICTAFVPVRALARVAALSGVRAIKGAAPVEPELNVSVPTIGVNVLRGPGPGFLGLNGEGVLIGDVDSGVDYGHGDFKDSTGRTRLVRIWDQTVTATPPVAFGYGAEWDSAAIDAGIATQVDQSGHGTHVLGIAGGDGSQTGMGVPAYTYAGVAPQASLVMVKTDFSTTGIVDGVAYVMNLADARGQDAVVNLSIGTQFGPHDGTSPFEAGLSALTGLGRLIVKSAGNDRGVARHAEAFAAGVGTNVLMTASGSSVNAAFGVDGYYESTENLEVKITSPRGSVIGPISRGGVNAAYPGQSTPDGSVYLENGLETTATGDHEIYFEVNVGSGQNMNGLWIITLIPVALGPANGEVDLWRFFSSNGVGAIFSSHNQPTEELISEPGNAVELITVGAFVSKKNWTGCNGTGAGFAGTPDPGNLAPFSSPGPTRDGRQKPDIAAPGTAIGSTTTWDIMPFCPAAPTPSEYLSDSLNHVIAQGTSMAAPHVVGAAALVMQTRGSMTPTEMKNFLNSRAVVDAMTGAVWNKDWGNGKLFLDATTATLLSLFRAEPRSEGVELRWELGEPERFREVRLERANAERGPWVAVEAERREEAGVTIVVDRGAAPGRIYFYRLVATLRTGSVVTFGPLRAEAGSPITRFAISSLAPNPTEGETRIEFSVPYETYLRLAIFDVQGREVALLAEGRHRPGLYQAMWSGTGTGGRVRAGLYFVRLQGAEFHLNRRVVVTR